ncbi:basic salivary proline-rich protein 1-like [Equus caballus]|uniref:basic salivary proline-rich protein 1-like n=1 Tax=Equus caballus TaxID=9796 RepID=UPI0038B40153
MECHAQAEDTSEGPAHLPPSAPYSRGLPSAAQADPQLPQQSHRTFSPPPPHLAVLPPSPRQHKQSPFVQEGHQTPPPQPPSQRFCHPRLLTPGAAHCPPAAERHRSARSPVTPETSLPGGGGSAAGRPPSGPAPVNTGRGSPLSGAPRAPRPSTRSPAFQRESDGSPGPGREPGRAQGAASRRGRRLGPQGSGGPTPGRGAAGQPGGAGVRARGDGESGPQGRGRTGRPPGQARRRRRPRARTLPPPPRPCSPRAAAARRARRTRRRRRRSLCLGTSLPSPLRAQPERSEDPARAGRGRGLRELPAARLPRAPPPPPQEPRRRLRRAPPAACAPPPRARAPGPAGEPGPGAAFQSGGVPDTCSLKGAASPM